MVQEIWEVQENKGKITEEYYPRETKVGLRNQEFQEPEGSNNRDSTVFINSPSGQLGCRLYTNDLVGSAISYNT